MASALARGSLRLNVLPMPRLSQSTTDDEATLALMTPAAEFDSDTGHDSDSVMSDAESSKHSDSHGSKESRSTVMRLLHSDPEDSDDTAADRDGGEENDIDIESDDGTNTSSSSSSTSSSSSDWEPSLSGGSKASNYLPRDTKLINTPLQICTYNSFIDGRGQQSQHHIQQSSLLSFPAIDNIEAILFYPYNNHQSLLFSHVYPYHEKDYKDLKHLNNNDDDDNYSDDDDNSSSGDDMVVEPHAQSMDWSDVHSVNKIRKLVYNLLISASMTNGIREQDIYLMFTVPSPPQIIEHLRFGQLAALCDVHMDRFGRRVYARRDAIYDDLDILSTAGNGNGNGTSHVPTHSIQTLYGTPSQSTPIAHFYRDKRSTSALFAENDIHNLSKYIADSPVPLTPGNSDAPPPLTASLSLSPSPYALACNNLVVLSEMDHDRDHKLPPQLDWDDISLPSLPPSVPQPALTRDADGNRDRYSYKIEDKWSKRKSMSLLSSSASARTQHHHLDVVQVHARDRKRKSASFVSSLKRKSDVCIDANIMQILSANDGLKYNINRDRSSSDRRQSPQLQLQLQLQLPKARSIPRNLHLQIHKNQRVDNVANDQPTQAKDDVSNRGRRHSHKNVSDHRWHLHIDQKLKHNKKLASLPESISRRESHRQSFLSKQKSLIVATLSSETKTDTDADIETEAKKDAKTKTKNKKTKTKKRFIRKYGIMTIVSQFRAVDLERVIKERVPQSEWCDHWELAKHITYYFDEQFNDTDTVCLVSTMNRQPAISYWIKGNFVRRDKHVLGNKYVLVYRACKQVPPTQPVVSGDAFRECVKKIAEQYGDKSCTFIGDKLDQQFGAGCHFARARCKKADFEIFCRFSDDFECSFEFKHKQKRQLIVAWRR